MSRDTNSKVEAYINSTFAHEDKHLKNIAEALRKDDKFGINVGAGEGQFLQFLIGLVKPKLAIEIGMLYGYSTLWMARALSEGAKLISIEVDVDNYKKAKELISQDTSVGSRLDFRNGNGLDVLAQISKEISAQKLPRPDFIFVDADKANYRNYLDWAMEHIRVGGVIVGDNTFLFGHMIGEDRGEKTSVAALESMRYFNETLANAKNFRATIIPTYEGMTVAHRLS